MRKHIFYFAVLALFLQLPASITRAQNVSVSGNVYEKNTVKNFFKTPHGTITSIWPDDMAAGDAIRGTVLYEPEGENQKKKSRNLEQLVKYTLSTISDNGMPDNGTPDNGMPAIGLPLRAIAVQDAAGKVDARENMRSNFSFTIPSKNVQSTFRLILKDPNNNIVGESRLPVLDKAFLMPVEDVFNIPGKGTVVSPAIKTDKTIYMSGENAVISLPPMFISYELKEVMVSGYYSLSIAGQKSGPIKVGLTPLVGSPRKTVVQIPLNVYGPGEITLEDKNKKVIASQKIHVLQLEASCPKTSLLKSEQTVLNVIVKGVKDCPADYLRLNLDNATTTSVQLGQSNHEELILETVSMNYSKIKWDYKAQDKKKDSLLAEKDSEKYESNQYSLQRSVTALQSGNFTINIGLSYPSSVYNDPFRQQLDALKTPEQFNNWQNALMNDMVKFYSDINHDQGLGDLFSEGNRPNKKPAEKWFKPVSTSAELDEAKSRVNNFISWPRIGQEVIVDYFDCTLEAGKAAVENAITNVGNAPVNIEVIQSALRYVEHQALVTDNKPLQAKISGMTGSGLLGWAKQVNDLPGQLQVLNDIQKIFNDASKGAVINSVNMVDMIDEDDTRHYNVTPLPDNGFKLEMSMSSISSSLGEWIRHFLDEQPLKKSGNISHVNFDNHKKAVFEFKDALITEISFPKMDAAAKDIPMIGITFTAEEIKYTPVSEKTKTTDIKPAKQWATCNFRIELEGLPPSFMTKLELPKFTQKITKDPTGMAGGYRLIPGKLEYPNITFYIPETDIKPWMDWYNNFEKNNDTKSGDIGFMNDKGESLFSVPLNNVKPVQINPAGKEVYEVVIASLPVQPATEETREEKVSKNDMIAFFSPTSKTLFYLPEYKTQIFDKFKPHLRADGKYDINLASMNRKSIRTVIDIVPANFMDLLNQDKKDSVKYNKDGFESTGELIMEKWDSTSATWYRFYKNAKCKRWKEPNEGTCGPIYVKDSTGKYVESGKSLKIATTGESHCYKGTEFCTEMYIVAIIEYIYDDANCKRLIKVKTLGGWSCE